MLLNQLNYVEVHAQRTTRCKLSQRLILNIRLSCVFQKGVKLVGAKYTLKYTPAYGKAQVPDNFKNGNSWYIFSVTCIYLAWTYFPYKFQVK